MRPLKKHLPRGSCDENRHSSCLTLGIILSYVTHKFPPDSVSVPCFPLPNLIFCLAIGNPCSSMERPSRSSSILAVAETRLPPLQACLSALAAGKNYLLFSTLKSPSGQGSVRSPVPYKKYNSDETQQQPKQFCSRIIRGALSPGDWPWALRQ